MNISSQKSSPSLSRHFFTLAVPKPTARQLGEIRQRWAEADRTHWRWVAPELLHLTLVFLGSRKSSEVTSMLAAGKAVAARSAPFPLACRGLGVFPGGGKPAQVLWADLDRSRALLELSARLDKELKRAGFVLGGPPFRPHVTIARRKRWKGVRPSVSLSPQLSDQLWGYWKASELVLMESHLGNGRPVYKRVASWPLSGSSG